jgi:nitroreductase
MEHRRVVARRRMVRRYLPDPIDPRALERIARAALRGPQAGQADGISVVVVTDPEQRAALALLAGEPGWVARGRFPWLSPAPAHLVICVDPGAYRRRYAEADKDPAALAVPWWWVDGGAALALVLLAAVDEGLAAGFLGAHALPGLAGALGLPEGIEPLGVVTVGRRHPEEAPARRRPHRPDAERIRTGRWGQVAARPGPSPPGRPTTGG